MKTELIRLSKSVVGSEEASAAAEVIKKGFLGMGLEVQAFEREICEFIGGNREVICVNTGTSALHLAVQACGIGPGDEVIVPSLTYVASFQAISATGATPVACDVNADTCTIDIEDAKSRITKNTKAIMPVHYASNRGTLDQVYELAGANKIRVIEDAAHAFGCKWKDQYVGHAGDVVCFSFDGIKNITSGEGGAVVTGDLAVASKIRDARLLGVSKDTEKRYAGKRSWEFDVTEQGWRYHMSNIMAAIGRVQLRRFREDFAEKRAWLANNYVRLLQATADIRHLDIKYGDIVPHIFPIFISSGKRDAVRNALLENNIECGIHYMPNHLLSYYKQNEKHLPTTEKLYKEMLTLPLHPDLTEGEQQRVVEIVLASVK